MSRYEREQGGDPVNSGFRGCVGGLSGSAGDNSGDQPLAWRGFGA